MTDGLEALSREWNELGRAFAKEVQERLARFHRGEVEDPELPADPRGEALAGRVLDAVVKLNAEGRWQEARRWLDPAHAPFIPRMADAGLPFVVALGHDEALFRRGSSYQEGHLWHVAGEELTPLPELTAAAISPDWKMLGLADAEGIRILRGFQGAEVARFPWPSSDELVPAWVPTSSRALYETESPASSLEGLCIANSGLRVAIATRSGVLVGDAQGGRVAWHLTLPRHDEPSEWLLEELGKGESAGFHGDMVHVAMTGDGAFLGCGAQDDGHYLFALDARGSGSLWAKLGFASEYPHDACFSEDGKYVAFNACHFYSGATIAADVQSVRNLVTEPYEEDSRTPVINAYLRVYASIWLPASALPAKTGAFALGGASLLTIVEPTGQVRSELLFGSSASGMDYCPRTQTLVLGSYSGFLHFLKPAEVDPVGVGWCPPKELKRWCFLKDLPPLQW